MTDIPTFTMNKDGRTAESIMRDHRDVEDFTPLRLLVISNSNRLHMISWQDEEPWQEGATLVVDRGDELGSEEKIPVNEKFVPRAYMVARLF